MKERYIPTKDLKTGAKVFWTVGSKTFEGVRPEIQRIAGNRLRKILTGSRNRIS